MAANVKDTEPLVPWKIKLSRIRAGALIVVGHEALGGGNLHVLFCLTRHTRTLVAVQVDCTLQDQEVFRQTGIFVIKKDADGKVRFDWISNIMSNWR